MKFMNYAMHKKMLTVKNYFDYCIVLCISTQLVSYYAQYSVCWTWRTIVALIFLDCVEVRQMISGAM